MIQEWIPVKIILSVCEKNPKKTRVFKTDLFLECAVVLLKTVADNSEFISDYSLQLTIAICLYSSIIKNNTFLLY